MWSATGRTDHLDATFLDAARAAVATLDRETAHEELSDYRFVRPDTVAIDTLVRDGRGTPVGPTGMTWAGFRPSDDACTYGYHVPGNLMAVHCLRLLGDLVPAAGGAGADELVAEAAALADRLAEGIAAYGLIEHADHGQIWAYEVDGLGHHLLMDDANMPGLLSLPLVAGIAVDDPLYRRTRAFVLSEDNPFYYRGRGRRRRRQSAHPGTVRLADRAGRRGPDLGVAGACPGAAAPDRRRRPPAPATCTRGSTWTTTPRTPGRGSAGPTRCSARWR